MGKGGGGVSRAPKPKNRVDVHYFFLAPPGSHVKYFRMKIFSLRDQKYFPAVTRKLNKIIFTFFTPIPGFCFSSPNVVCRNSCCLAGHDATANA